MKKIPAKKSLGQHFLRSDRVAEHIVDAATLTKRDTVLEIGPGTGVLTKKLLARARRVVVIEKDKRLATKLRDMFQNDPLEVVPEDVLQADLSLRGLKENGYVVVANIPYYITGAIIEKFLSTAYQPERMVLLVQKEVAERIAKERKGSVLSMSVRAYGEPRYVKTVPAKHFSPKPKVDSAILLVEHISRKRFVDVSEEQFFSVLKAGFAHKRKKLSSNLTKLSPRRKLGEIFQKLALPENTRAEELSIEQWFALARTLQT